MHLKNFLKFVETLKQLNMKSKLRKNYVILNTTILKQKIKLFLLLLSFSLMLSAISCQVEEDVVSSKNQSGLKVKKIGENRINNYSFALEKINTINKAKKENMNSKIIIDTVLDILIDTDEAMLIEGNNFTSLTFPVYRENSNDFENLVVQHMNDITKTYLVNYGPNKEAAMNGQNTKASIREIEFNTESLNNKIFYSSSNTVVYSDETGNLNYYCDETYEITTEYGYMDVANPSTGESTITLINSSCSYWWSFHYSTGGGAGGSSSNNHGGLGAGTGSTTVTTAPITTTMSSQIVKAFVKNLSPTQFAWWTNPSNASAVASISSYLPQVDADQVFAITLIDFSLNNQTYASNLFNHLNSENWSNDSILFTNYVIDILEANPNANPLIGADCRSFEFAQPPGATKKGCAVTNFNHTFYTAGVFPNGSPYFGEINSTVPIAYFTMPTWMTNGRAANLTAKAVTFAIKATDLYYAANPTVSEVVLGQYFSNRLAHFLNAVGGTVSTSTPPFSIPSPAPYITSLIGISNPYDCE